MIRSMIVAAAMLIALPSAAAEPKKMGEAPGELFFTGKGGSPLSLERIYPGITAALELSDEQKLALHDAARQTIGDPKLRESGQALKNNATATEADRAQVAKSMTAARTTLKESVDKVLTAEQKALVAKIQAAIEESQKAAMGSIQAELVQSKGDADRTAKLRERLQGEVRIELAERLDKILTPDQKTAVSNAGALQRDREEDAAKSKGGKKGGI